ncbi:hypothetical protein ACFLVH_04380 [Chloroflexota bacterium]
MTQADSTKKPEYRHSWGEVIQYLDGLCFGIAPNGQTICLGKEAEIKEILADPGKRSINSVINEILELERELQAKESNTDGNSEHRTRKTSLERGRFTRPLGVNTAAIRQSKAFKRLPLHISKSKK